MIFFMIFFVEAKKKKTKMKTYGENRFNPFLGRGLGYLCGRSFLLFCTPFGMRDFVCRSFEWFLALFLVTH